MQNYLDSSVISIIEDLSLSEQSKTCLDAQNELSLLTAITEILDSTDDETLSPFDTIMDAELLTSPRERENTSFQKFLTLSRPLLECESPTLEQPKALRPLSNSSSSVSVVGKTDTDVTWNRATHGLEDPVLPKKQVCSTPRVERKVSWHRAREQPLPQRSDGEEEEEEAALSLELDRSMEAVDFCVSEAGAALEEHEDPCIINTGDVSLSELVKSMHPYCLPTFTVCLDPDTEPVAKELLSSPVLLEIVPGEGESVEIPVVLQPLTPNSPDLEPQLLGVEETTGESIPEDRGEPPGAPTQENRLEEEKEEKLPGKETSHAIPEATSPLETAALGASGPNKSSWHSTEAPAGGKRECSEKGRGRERARKSRKKKAEEDQSKQARPGRDCVAHRLRSTGSGQPHAQAAISRQRAECPSVQVSDFLAQQLERARKEGQMELHAERASRPRGRPQSTAGALLPKKVKQELQKEPTPETVNVALEKNKTLVSLEKTAPSMEGQPAAACPSPTDQAESQGDAQPSARQSSGVLEAASQLPEQGVGLEPAQRVPAAEPSEGLPKEAKPKALSLREYRIRMLHRQPSAGGSQEGKKQVASKWPSVPEPPTELAEIPCLVSPMRSTTEADSAQKGPDKPTSPAAVPSPASKAPSALPSAPAPAAAPPPPSAPMPFVAPNMPPAAGVAPPGMPPASAGAYALYPPVPSWPCFSPQPMGCPALAPAQPLPAPSAATAQPSSIPPAVPVPQAVPTQPPEESQAATPNQLPKAPPAAICCPAEESPAPVGESPGTHATEKAVEPGKEAADKTSLEPKAAAGQEVSGQKSTSQAVAPPRKAGRESSLPTKAPHVRPWRHQPLLSPAQPRDSSKDIVQAFISEIGIEATDLSSLLEQFEKSEAKKEETPVQPPEERQLTGSSGPETQQEAPTQQDRKPPDGLQASELANVAGLTPPATPPHQLWKPLPAVSLLAKTKSPGSLPQEGPQKTTKLTKAKPLLPNKIQVKSVVPAPASTAPSHVCSGDHDYCILGAPQPESSNSPGTQPPAEGGSRWNVKHHQDITIKPISSLTKWTLDQPEPPPPAPDTTMGHSPEPLGMACPSPLDYRTTIPNKASTGCSSPPTSVLLSPAASPCREQEVLAPSAQPSHAAAKRSLRCYRRPQDSPSPSTDSWRAGRSRASRSFSSSSDGASESSSSSSSSSSRSRSRSLSPPPKRWRRYRSRCSHSSSSRSSCGSCGRSRDRSSSSSSTSSYSSRSTSRSQSRSPSPRGRSSRWRRYSYDAQDHYQRQRILQKERAIEERRVVFIGKIPSRMTRSELRHRFSVFGDIEECTLHFRSEGDNYGFVTYRYAEEAFAAIESGHKLRRPDEQPFDLCFGGRRQFCRRNYADLDSNREDFDPAPVKSKFDSLDFDTLLRQAQRSLRR
ncbi:peroxisome proliferator-activated receptor gamma coactivator-related protein 1 [Geospiza fortis]|uniref:Peroxisome proliferator-activated receptor gamma coactivator-related protein 1 n=1 Tax=Geospiza fortis TaxID=48883 RepID=A0A8N5EUY0_GEOFO|nr:peroxisome proliferator-activated receptor gamma coactivator-related protein 1 [Geospiza fortis]